MNNFKTICIEIYEYFIVLQNFYNKKIWNFIQGKIEKFRKIFFLNHLL